MTQHDHEVENALTRAFRELYRVAMIAIPRNPPYEQVFNEDRELKRLRFVIWRLCSPNKVLPNQYCFCQSEAAGSSARRARNSCSSKNPRRALLRWIVWKTGFADSTPERTARLNPLRRDRQLVRDRSQRSARGSTAREVFGDTVRGDVLRTGVAEVRAEVRGRLLHASERTTAVCAVVVLDAAYQVTQHDAAGAWPMLRSDDFRQATAQESSGITLVR